jgi:hypothetical protein
MGSYASQMSEEELWQVDHYVMKLKAELEGKPVRSFEEESMDEVEMVEETQDNEAEVVSAE